MDQAAHAWIALRAVALIEDTATDKNLAALLSPHAAHAALGAWLPDLADAKRGGGQTQHHVLKMLPMDEAAEAAPPTATGKKPKPRGKERFIARKKDLLGRMAFSPAARAFLQADTRLTPAWWARPYRADPAPGQHIANRAMGLASALRDLLIIGDEAVDKLVPGAVSFRKQAPADALTRPEQAALYFFMLSHFVADACMPCHCDGRPACGYDAGLHMELERHWSKTLGPAFSKAALAKAAASDELLQEARAADANLALALAAPPPSLPAKRDVWYETIDAARASFALMALILPESSHPYRDGPKRAEFQTVFAGPAGDAMLSEISRICLADAVYNTAAAWLEIWKKVGTKLS